MKLKLILENELPEESEEKEEESPQLDPETIRRALSKVKSKKRIKRPKKPKEKIEIRTKLKSWSEPWKDIRKYEDLSNNFQHLIEIKDNRADDDSELREWYIENSNKLSDDQKSRWKILSDRFNMSLMRSEFMISELEQTFAYIHDIVIYKQLREKFEEKYDSPSMKFITDDSDIQELQKHSYVSGYDEEPVFIIGMSESRERLDDADIYKQLKMKLREYIDEVSRGIGSTNDAITNLNSIIGDKEKIKSVVQKLDEEEEEEEKIPSVQEKYNRYLAWALGGGKLQNLPPNLVMDIENTRKFPSARGGIGEPDISGDLIIEGKMDVSNVSSWKKPIAYTPFEPEQYRDEIGDNTTLAWILVPSSVGGGTIWYNLWNNANAYNRARQNKEWPRWASAIRKGWTRDRVNMVRDVVAHAPYNYKGESIANSLLWSMDANRKNHPSIYFFLNSLLLGYPKNTAVNVADKFIYEEGNQKADAINTPADSKQEISFWTKITNRLKDRYRLVKRQKPKTAGIIARLIRYLKDVLFIDDLKRISTTENKHHRRILQEDFKEKYNLSDDDINILLECTR